MTGAGPHWRIALPGLAAASDRVPGFSTPSLEWLLARADRSQATRPWREWLLEDAALGEHVLARFPAGPCVHTAWTGAMAGGRWACAGPVHLVTGLDHLRLAAPAPLPLEAQESSAFVAELNTRLAGSGFALHSIPGRGWLCECPQDLECTGPEPADAIGGDLRDWLPEGRDALRVRAWVNEAQMILHEHPLNDRRAARGDPPVNSVWLWGFGSASQPLRNTTSVLLTDDDWLDGLWRLHGGRAVGFAGIGAAPPTLREPGTTRIAMVNAAYESAGDWPPTALQSLLEATLTGLERGHLARVSIHTGSELLHLDRRARWRFWRRPRPLWGRTK